MAYDHATKEVRSNAAGLDYPPAVAPSKKDIYLLLVACRFAEARNEVSRWTADNPIRLMIERGQYWLAECTLDRELHPNSNSYLPMRGDHVAAGRAE